MTSPGDPEAGRSHAVRLLVEEDVLAASALMADAFTDDPVMTWLFPHVALRPGRLRRYYELDLHHRLVPTADAITTTAMSGVACWVPPGREQIPLLTRPVSLLPSGR